MGKFKWGTYVLPENDEILFYRDVLCLNHNELVAGSKISELSKPLRITIDFSPWDNNLPSVYKFGTINITTHNDSLKPNTSALIRHLRNAFCHQNIFVDGENCYLRDSVKTNDNLNEKPKSQTTMVGYVNYNDLKALIKSLKK